MNSGKYVFISHSKVTLVNTYLYRELYPNLAQVNTMYLSMQADFPVQLLTEKHLKILGMSSRRSCYCWPLVTLKKCRQFHSQSR